MLIRKIFFSSSKASFSTICTQGYIHLYAFCRVWCAYAEHPSLNAHMHLHNTQVNATLGAEEMMEKLWQEPGTNNDYSEQNEHKCHQPGEILHFVKLGT